jgi:hypothetical protein
MAEAFQLSCVTRSETNWGHHHITGLGTVTKPGSPDRWPITTVLARLAGGDLFYAVGASGDPVFVRAYRCWCGFETIRMSSGEDIADQLDALSRCEWEIEKVGAALPPFTLGAPPPRNDRSSGVGQAIGGS